MKVLIALAMVLGLAAVALAEDKRVCVRDYSPPDERAPSPCEMGLDRYHYVQDMDRPDEFLCTITYDDERCKFTPQEFDHVRNLDDEVVCVVNFHQPPIAAFCGSNPDLYKWVKHAW